MERPTIFHDHILGQNQNIKHLIQDAEQGLIGAEEFRNFFVAEGYYHYSLMQAVRLLMIYRSYGQQVFMVGPRFRDLLCRTSIKGVPVGAIKLPYPAFYIALPDCPWKLWGGDTGFHEITGVMVGVQPTDEGLNLVFFLWGEENHKARCVGDDASFWFTISLNEALAQEDMDLESYVRMVLQDPGRENSDFQEVNDNAPHSSKDFMVTLPDNGYVRDQVVDTAANVVRMAINLIVYLQSVGASKVTHQETQDRREAQKDLEGLGKKPAGKAKKKQRKLQKLIDRLSEAHITWLGKDVESSPRGPSGPRSQAIRHWVRGHWWPRLDNRDALDRHGIHWRQPYERNADSGEAMPSREYRVED